ncbi:hypothetical protein Slin15195_G036810 [Septoria linicola]|uniref:Uncharacterized protein n=1 Tax=Septoria linicola TaxID=215465 RepID=A0A9Q9AJ95_9PEZI|nr:hypothetical protein Slin14017_G118240 [Septoria linicola]USW50362.1 hypothetical protein Slin15195_G036810 [Septoria linicola]
MQVDHPPRITDKPTIQPNTPSTDHYNDAGWPCANSHFQIGGSLTLGLKASRTRRECHDESILAAQRGEAWFKCKCQKGLAHSWLTWSPLGWNSCKNKNGAPCKVVDGWWNKEGDGGAACRAEGFCPITTEIYLQTVRTTVTVETTREVGGTSQTKTVTSNRALSTNTTSGQIETVTGVSTTETLTWQTPIDLPVIIGQTPTSASSPSESSSDDSETVIIVTMTSGQTPTTTSSSALTSASSKSGTSSAKPATASSKASTSSTKPITTSQRPTTSFNSITSTIIDGKTYTYLKEPEATSSISTSSRTSSPIPPPQPITSVKGGATFTFVPVMQNTSTMGRKLSVKAVFLRRLKRGLKQDC